jgi:hypothetical protein
MLVHFIGGPAHGRSEAIPNPHPTYRMAELKPMPSFATLYFPPAEVPFVEHEYKITRRTPRYAIAEWQALPVDVRFEVRLEVDPFDHAAFLERRTEEIHGVRCVGAAVASGIEAQLDLVVRVEGPEDATALELAAKKVQHYLDAELPPCKQHIRSVGASVS